MAWVRKGVFVVSVLSVTPSVLAAPGLLPLKRVRLYETGVAYFERSGTLSANTVTLPVPASHLDDALKAAQLWAEAGGDARFTLRALAPVSSPAHGNLTAHFGAASLEYPIAVLPP